MEKNYIVQEVINYYEINNYDKDRITNSIETLINNGDKTPIVGLLLALTNFNITNIDELMTSIKEFPSTFKIFNVDETFQKIKMFQEYLFSFSENEKKRILFKIFNISPLSKILYSLTSVAGNLDPESNEMYNNIIDMIMIEENISIDEMLLNYINRNVNSTESINELKKIMPFMPNLEYIELNLFISIDVNNNLYNKMLFCNNMNREIINIINGI